jgi:hypothetical protein
MPLSPVDLYEQLKPHLGENETKALIEYVDGKIRGEVATKEDLDPLKEDIRLLQEDIRLLQEDTRVLKINLEQKATKEDLLLLENRLKEEIWKLRVLVIVVLVVVIILNPKVVELVGRILGVVK